MPTAASISLWAVAHTGRACDGFRIVAMTIIVICQNICDTHLRSKRKEAPMTPASLGTNGPEVSALGLGCMGMSDLYGPADKAESIVATIRAALDAGVNLLDTGDYYAMGDNEMLIREALRPRPRAGRHQRQVRRPARSRWWLGGRRRAPGGDEELPRLLAAPPRHRSHRHLPARPLQPRGPDRGDGGAIAEMVEADTSATSASRRSVPRRYAALRRRIRSAICRSSTR